MGFPFSHRLLFKVKNHHHRLIREKFGTGRNHFVHIHNRELNLHVEVASEPRVPSHSPAILRFRSGTVRREANATRNKSESRAFLAALAIAKLLLTLNGCAALRRVDLLT